MGTIGRSVPGPDGDLDALYAAWWDRMQHWVALDTAYRAAGMEGPLSAATRAIWRQQFQQAEAAEAAAWARCMAASRAAQGRAARPVPDPPAPLGTRGIPGLVPLGAIPPGAAPAGPAGPAAGPAPVVAAPPGPAPAGAAAYSARQDALIARVEALLPAGMYLTFRGLTGQPGEAVRILMLARPVAAPREVQVAALQAAATILGRAALEARLYVDALPVLRVAAPWAVPIPRAQTTVAA